MNSLEVYVNDKLLDLGVDSILSLNYAVNNIAELKDRDSDYSFPFKVPATANNKEALDYSYDVSSISDIPYRRLPARIVSNGVPIVPIGVALVKSYEGFYSITIQGGNALFFKSLGSKRLSDLDLSDLDHDFTISEVLDSFTNTTGYKYPIINYGRITSATTIDVRYLRPAVFFRAILDRIFLESDGYSPAGDFINSYELNKGLFPFTNDKLKGGKKYVLGKGVSGIDYSYPDITLGYFSPMRFPLTDSNPSIDPNNTITDGLPSGSYYKALYKGRYLFRYSIRYENLSGSAPLLETIVKRGGSTFIYWQEELDGAGFDLGQTSGTYVVERAFTLEAGDELYLEITNIGIGSLTTYSDSFIEVYSAEDLEVEYGAKVSVSDNLPALTCLEFLRLLCNLYALVPDTDPVLKKVYFRQYRELSKNSAKAIDLTDNLSSSSRSISYRIGSYGQLNRMRYKVDDNDKDFTQGSADSAIEVLDETLEADKELFTLPVAGSYQSTDLLQGLLVTTIRKQEPPASGSDALSISTAPRILYDYIKDGPIDFPLTFTDGSTTISGVATSIPLPYFNRSPDPASIDKLLDLNSLRRDNYSELEAMLKRAKVLEVKAILPAVFLPPDHFIPIYDAKEGAYFYLNRVKNYTPDGRPCTLELIRL